MFSDSALYGYPELLEQFPSLLRRASRLRTEPPAPLPMRAAVVGFALGHNVRLWTSEEYDYLESHLNGEGLSSLCEENAPAELAFIGMCLGRLCGLHCARRIDVDQVARGEWILAAFLGAHRDEIRRQWALFESDQSSASTG